MAKVGVADLMSRFVETVEARAPLRDAAVRLRAFGLGFLVVLDRGDIAGVVTDRDIVLRGAGADPPASRLAVRDVMTPDVVSCASDRPVEEALRLMEAHQVRRLVVRNAHGGLAGVLSLADLARSGFGASAARLLAASIRSAPQAALL